MTVDDLIAVIGIGFVGFLVLYFVCGFLAIGYSIFNIM